MLSIIIPTLNEETRLPDTLAALSAAPDAELIVSDAGSADRTADIAAESGARLVKSSPGRGQQLAAGARASSGDWLLFVHADTRLDKGWFETVRAFIRASVNRRRAGYFCLRLDDVDPRAEALARRVAWRADRLGLPYGDQGLLIHRGFYFSLGGFREIPLFEDVDLVRRVGRRRLTALEAAAVTSAERYRRNGYRLQSTRNVTLLVMYFLGFSPRFLARIYR